jgi:hypothetical protein
VLSVLVARLISAALGAIWLSYNWSKLKWWLTTGREKAQARSRMMIPYRAACMLFGAVWVALSLVMPYHRGL